MADASVPHARRLGRIALRLAAVNAAVAVAAAVGLPLYAMFVDRPVNPQSDAVGIAATLVFAPVLGLLAALPLAVVGAAVSGLGLRAAGRDPGRAGEAACAAALALHALPPAAAALLLASFIG